MLAIDCLLKNTEVVDAVRAAIEYIGTKRAKEGKEASLESVYKILTENGIEIDLGSTAKIYADVLSTKNHPYFSTHEEVQEVAGRYFDDLSRNILLRENKKGEKKISELSPAQAVVKKLSDLFTNTQIKDERTKSILRTMQDAYEQYAKKLVGPKPEDVNSVKDTRGFEQIISDALDKENLGYVDKATGLINNFDKLHEGAKDIMKKLRKEIGQSNDPVLIAQWDTYAKSIESAVRSLVFSTEEGKKVLYDALKSEDGGEYVKVLKDGTEVLDHDKLAGDIGSLTQYRENVIDALTSKGFSEEDAVKAADSLQKEYFELRGKSMELLRKEQLRKDASHTDIKEPAPKVSVKEMIEKSIKRGNTYSELKEDAAKDGVDVSAHEPKITLSLHEAGRLMYEALKNSEKYNKEIGEADTAVDWVKVAMSKISEDALNKEIKDYMISEGVSEADATDIMKYLEDKSLHKQLTKDIEDYSKTQLDNRQDEISKERAITRKSDMTHLAELDAMGIFNGAHDDLLHHVLGIDGADQNTRKALMDIMEKKQILIQTLGTREFLYRSLDAELQHEVNELIEDNIADKSKMGKIAKVAYDYQNLANFSIIANPFNIAENAQSGFIANAAATMNTIRQMGLKEGLKVFYETNRLWMATFKDVAKGGIHYGFENGKFTQGSSITDKTTIKNWDKQNAAQKTWTILTAYAHAGLSALDSANKASISQKTTILNLHKALTEIPDTNGHKMSKEEANEYLNENLFGKSFDQAKTQAENIYRRLGVKYDKNMIERTARELVQANLFSDNHVNADVVEAAMRGGYQTASIALGHDTAPGVLGFISGGKRMKGLQQSSQSTYDRLVKEDRMSEAHWHKIVVQTMLVNGAFKFAHGVANWLVLRPITAGVGLITGGVSKVIRHSDIIDYTNKQQLEASFIKTQQANMEIARGLAGLMQLGIYAAGTSLYGAINDEDKSKGTLAAGFKGIKNNPILNKAFSKVSPDVLAMMYFSYTSKNKHSAGTYASMEGFGKYVLSLTNMGSGFSIPEKSVNIIKNKARHTYRADKEAAGDLGDLMRSTLLPGGGELPFLKSYKTAYYLSKWPATGDAELPPYYNPQTLLQGLLNNGWVNDIDNVLGTDLMQDSKHQTNKKHKRVY